MSIRLDPRRLGTLKQLAADAGTRPGDLVRIWVEERLDAERRGEAPGTGGVGDLATQLQSLADRVAALEAAGGGAPANDSPADETPTADATASGQTRAVAADAEPANADGPSANGDAPKGRGRNRVTAKPSGERVALHDEIIAVLNERGPLPASEIATLIADRGRYAPPRSGKPLDAATVNARISNPTYRGRFTRAGGRIGLADAG
jgi:hypothetical protein